MTIDDSQWNSYLQRLQFQSRDLTEQSKANNKLGMIGDRKFLLQHKVTENQRTASIVTPPHVYMRYHMRCRKADCARQTLAADWLIADLAAMKDQRLFWLTYAAFY